MKCKRCGSHAINHHLHDRDGSGPDLCDVCYWRDRAERAEVWQLFAMRLENAGRYMASQVAGEDAKRWAKAVEAKP